MRDMKKSKKYGWILLVVFVIFVIWIAWGNTALELNEYQIKSDKLPNAFLGFRIAQVSDLHNDEMGKDNRNLLRMLEKAKPDIIVMTGDIIDSYETEVDVSLQFVEKAVKIAPCYYVPGNHESRLYKEVYLDFEEKIKSYGVCVLHDEAVLLEQAGEYISLAGIDDPIFAVQYDPDGDYSTLGSIQNLNLGEEFQILLSHRPELFQMYVDANVDLVFTGHAHGGQFRLPFIGGLFAPNQGYFPEYDAGLFVDGNTNMIVSRGIGNSLFPLRFNNRPEVVVVELQH